jgi:hypothetical protein
MKSSFEYFLNTNQVKLNELLTKFIDKKLRGEKGLSDNEVEVILEKVSSSSSSSIVCILLV